MSSDPIRLRDDPACSPELRADLAGEPGALAATLGTSAGLGRLKIAIEGGAKLSEAGQVVASGVKGAAWLGLAGAVSVPWIALVVLATAAAVGVAVFALGPSRGHGVAVHATKELVASSAAPVAAVESARVDLAGTTVAEPAGVERAALPAATPPARAAMEPRRAPAAAAAGSGTDVVAAEMAQLVELRRLVRVDPSGALEASGEGDRRFPGGLFAQEREAIAIGALARLGRAGEAAERARVFLARYPHSPFGPKVALDGRVDARPASP